MSAWVCVCVRVCVCTRAVWGAEGLTAKWLEAVSMAAVNSQYFGQRMCPAGRQALWDSKEMPQSCGHSPRCGGHPAAPQAQASSRALAALTLPVPAAVTLSGRRLAVIFKGAGPTMLATCLRCEGIRLSPGSHSGVSGADSWPLGLGCLDGGGSRKPGSVCGAVCCAPG